MGCVAVAEVLLSGLAAGRPVCAHGAVVGSGAAFVPPTQPPTAGQKHGKGC